MAASHTVSILVDPIFCLKKEIKAIGSGSGTCKSESQNGLSFQRLFPLVAPNVHQLRVGSGLRFVWHGIGMINHGKYTFIAQPQVYP